MANISDVLKTWKSNLQIAGDRATVPLNQVLAIMAADAANPGCLSYQGGTVVAFGDTVTDGVDLQRIFPVAGVLYHGIVAETSSDNLELSIDDIPEKWVPRSHFNIGRNTESFLSALEGLWDKVAHTSFISGPHIDGIKKILASGIVPYCANPQTCTDFGLPPELCQPPGLNDKQLAQWIEVCAQFTDAMRKYLKAQMVDAQAAVIAAQNNVKLWNSIYVAVEAVRDLPKNIASSALNSLMGVFFNGPVLILVGVAAVGFMIYATRGKIVTNNLKRLGDAAS